jgi:hypothetical protein
MRIFNYIRPLLLIFLIGCGETDKPQKYIFDANGMENNIKKYTISNGPMDEFTCEMTSLLFSREMLNVIKLNRKINLNDLKKGTPTTIELYNDKIVWNDLGQDTKINKNKVVIKGLENETINLNLIINENNIHFKLKDKKVVCIFPFKKIK